jgi:hypothetical protein
VFNPRTEQLIKGLAALSLAAFGSLISRSGVNQLWLLVPGLIALVLSAYLYKYSERAEALTTGSELSLLLYELNYSSQQGARATYHEVKRDWKTLGRRRCFRQLINYQPEDQRGRGSRYPTDKWIGGMAYREKRDIVENFQSTDMYRQKMVSTYGFTEEEIGQRAPDRLSFMAFPVLNRRHKVKGLIWFDALVCDAFPPHHAQVDAGDFVKLVTQRIRERMVS